MTLVWGLTPEDPIDSMQKLPRNRDKCLKPSFMTAKQPFVEVLQVRIETNGNQGGHVERSAQMAVSSSADA